MMSSISLYSCEMAGHWRQHMLAQKGGPSFLNEAQISVKLKLTSTKIPQKCSDLLFHDSKITLRMVIEKKNPLEIGWNSAMTSSDITR